jgi:hypothetical protein
MSFQVWNFFLLFLHMIVPIGYLGLPEAWICFKYATLGYAVCHSIMHFTGPNIRSVHMQRSAPLKREQGSADMMSPLHSRHASHVGHCSGASFAESLTWSHVVWIPMLIQLILTPGERTVATHRGHQK